mgnify:CR=1 FL=1
MVVQGNPKVTKPCGISVCRARTSCAGIEAGQSVNDELLDTIRMITTIMNGMQEEFAYDR